MHAGEYSKQLFRQNVPLKRLEVIADKVQDDVESVPIKHKDLEARVNQDKLNQEAFVKHSNMAYRHTHESGLLLVLDHAKVNVVGIIYYRSL